MRRMLAMVAVVATMGLGLNACGSTSSSSSGGTPQKGGTLNMLGTGDVDYMDPNVSYYTTGYLALRMFSRQLLTYPAIQGQTTTVAPDLATALPTVANGGISADGLTYKLTIRKGAMWNTTPPRQVTAADAVRGLERTCNPVQPFGGLPDFETLIVGMESFCTAFSQVAQKTGPIEAFMDSHSIAGATVDPSNPLTVVYKLTQPATYFTDQLAMPAFSPAPVEFLKYLPGGNALAQNTLSDGPYEIQSYDPTKSIVFVRNPAWKASSDPIRKAYVDRIVVSETGNQTQIQQELETNSPAADMGWDAPVPTADIPALLANKDPKLTLGQTFGTDPYVLFNTISPNNNGAFKSTAVRQAVEYAINRADLVQDDGGPQIAPPLTHILPAGILGSKQYDPYPNNLQTARQKLTSALPAGTKLHLVVLYQSSLDFESKMFQTLQADLGKVGISVSGDGVPSSAFYARYLEVPRVAQTGVWDLALAQWFPDWYGNAALSFFNPLFSGSFSFPPSGSNFGFYNDPTTNHLIQEASTATSSSQAESLWGQADQQVMADAAIFPITSPTQPVYHAAEVHNTVFVPNILQFDPTNVWLTNG
jgi:peptide/nickel transport system substrate-binding protein